MRLAGLPRPVFAWALIFAAASGHAGVTPDMQRAIRESTFEVVMKKPVNDPVGYEKPLPLDLLPYIERTDAYRSVGTAFALGHNTYVTAAHVIEVAIASQFGPPELRRSDGTVFAIDRILKFSMHEDFVVFSLRDDPGPSGFTVNRDPQIDEPVLAVGNALGEGIVIRDGLLTSRTAEEQDGRWKWIRFSAAASPGNSGGPLCDGEGKVIGIVIGKSPNENLNYSLPIVQVLDGEASKARFDQKNLIALPYLHGTATYAYRDEFKLPLSWEAFVETFQKVAARHNDESRAQILKAYEDTSFPRGPGAEELLSEPVEDDPRPRLIVQQPDGTWIASVPSFERIELPPDGSVSVAGEAGAKLVHLVRPGSASDDAFYADSKTFMDLALKGLNLRRPVGADQVRVISLGAAKSESMFTDPYGRKWQQRVWAVPFMDAYLVGMLLPTPDGYSAIIIFAPSFVLYDGKQLAQLLAAQLDVSYHGTLGQWQAALRRRPLLPDALSAVKLESSPNWALQTRRFASGVPSTVLTLTEKSPMTLTMGFSHDAARTVWDVQGIRWYQDNRQDAAVALWRRARPAPATKLELRNKFDSIRAHRAPYDGSLSRETAETYAATSVLDVPGKKPGTISADLAYGATLYMLGPRGRLDVARSLDSIAGATRILEPGLGEDIASGKAAPSSVDNAFGALEQEARARMQEVDKFAGRDIRGKLASDDIQDFVTAMRNDMAALPAAGAPGDSKKLEEAERQRLNWLRSYWSQYPGLTHNREMWAEFLRRNNLPDDTPHEAAVRECESALLGALAERPSAHWNELAVSLHGAYVAERRALVKRNPRKYSESDLIPRTAPCPPAATGTSGTALPKAGNSLRTLDELWPAASKRLGEEGTVLAKLHIGSAGCVVSLLIVGSSGSQMLDEAVISYFESMEFVPGEANGKAIETTATVPVVFNLTK